MNDFKDMLKYLRKQKHLTQRELADKIGISYGAIAMYECGKRMPTLEIEEMLADFFNVSLDVLRGRDTPSDFSITRDEYNMILSFREAPKAEQDVIKRILAYQKEFERLKK